MEKQGKGEFVYKEILILWANVVSWSQQIYVEFLIMSLNPHSVHIIYP